MACEFHFPSVILPSELWRTLARVMAGTLLPLVQLMHECALIVDTAVLFVTYKYGFLCTS